MFKSLLIANRGEIACRVVKTCARLGIRPIAVHSEADADALHVRMAREAGGSAVAIGPPPAAQSYLDIDRIVAACRETGAEAVHPGYGFLSENARFAEALEAAGIAFVGPTPHAIRAMGDKIESKRLAKQAGVNTVPGHPDALDDPEAAVAVAEEIGYPVMLKASAGGGGKGMRVARSAAEVREGLASARSEAKSSFGDDRVLVEKFVEEPRHIEIQVLADAHGNTVHLFERECSIQRRHQKVIEEAPSPFLDPETRARMGAQAVALAAAVGYRSAGTVEFIVDRDKSFYFLEMNTRLQVEHPVTEMITGLDLVELMLRVADGERLPFGQDDLKIRGWALEARVYAEDPVRNFLPSIGRLVRWRPPAETAHVRVDTGVMEGGEISMHYDPMVAKLVTHGPDRTQAIGHMRQALDACVVRGVKHNIGFLAALAAHPRFAEGRLTTGFIAEEFPDGFTGGTLDDLTRTRLIAVLATANRMAVERDRAVAGRLAGTTTTVSEHWVVRIGRENHPVAVRPAAGGFEVLVDGREIPVTSDWQLGEVLFDGRVDGQRLICAVERAGVGWRASHAGAEIDAFVLTPTAARHADLMPDKPPPDMSKYLLSPMPGLLVSLAVGEGQRVEAGEALAVVEAMKMENILRATVPATVAKLHAKPGENLSVDQKILEFD
ncbi:MAG: acetyl/propionyl/methylcrotonyl-CoA carboxylase subunit alpha [Azospirillaceae bacterium]